jgi:hypothetical protein
MQVAARAILMISLALALAGCNVVEPSIASKSPLAPLVASPDAITLEVFSVPVPRGEEQVASLWKLVDEQTLPADLRQRLEKNGFRAGVLGPSVPAELAEVLKVSEKRVQEGQEFTVALDPEESVNLRVVHAKAGKRVEVAIPETRKELQLLEITGGEVGGKTYSQAECRLALKANYENDGRVLLEIVPEVHHGAFQSRMRGNDGMMVFTQERPKRVFDELKMTPRLGPGQMVLLASRPDRPASAGYHFFHDTRGDRPVVMLWVVRIARGTHDTAFFEKPELEGLSAVSSDIEE